jgi:hypothetical protein
MADISEWLENTNQPMDEIFIGDPMDQVMPLNIDKDGNSYFDMPHAWNIPFRQSPIDAEPLPIDLSFYTTTDHTAPTTSGQTIVTVSEHLIKASNKILVYLTQILEIPEVPKDVDEKSTKEMTFTAEELEVLESIIRDDSEPSIPNDIEGIRVNTSPRSKKSKR